MAPSSSVSICITPPCNAGLERLLSLNEMVTTACANLFADLFPTAISLEDDAEVESNPAVRILTLTELAN